LGGVQVFDNKGNFLRVFHSGQPSSVTISEFGTIYILDFGNISIYALDNNNNNVETYSGSFLIAENPKSILYNKIGNSVIVLNDASDDPFNCIDIYTENGTYITSIPLPACNAATVANNGTIYVLYQPNTIKAYDNNGQFLYNVSVPSEITQIDNFVICSDGQFIFYDKNAYNIYFPKRSPPISSTIIPAKDYTLVIILVSAIGGIIILAFAVVLYFIRRSKLKKKPIETDTTESFYANSPTKTDYSTSITYNSKI